MTEKTEPSLRNGVDPANFDDEHRLFTLALRDANHSQLEAFLIPGFDPQDPRICSANARVSVLYPLDCGAFRPPETANFSIGFLAPRRPLELLSGLDERCRKMALFGCGLCSVVLIASDRLEIDAVIKVAGEALYAWERWDIEGTIVANCEDDSAKQCPLNLKQIDVRCDSGLSDSTSWLIHELFLNLNRFYQNAQRYAPFVVDELQTLANDVNELIAEIRGDEDFQRHMHEAPPPEEEKENSLQEAHLELLGAKKRLNANVDLLVQLNSALVYAVSQAFAGAIPIRQRFSHISQHSLLGTGTAWRAIQRTCSSIFATFRDMRFPEKLREQLEEAGSTANPSSLDPEQELSELRLNTRVVHFSARSGFGESDAAITCPSQTIQVCDQPEWSLCTATHEILHAHVRELIAAIFCEPLENDVPEPFDQSLAAAVTEYREHLAARSHSASRRISSLQELRHGLIEFALGYRASIVKARDKHGIDHVEFEEEEVVVVTLPRDIETIFRAFKKSFRLLEETVVHILDLHYFFAGDLELFSDSIWHSWSIVPSVIDKLDWYVLRTLLALASMSKGDPYQRLDEAAKVLSDSLNKIIRRQKGSVIAKEVLQRLNTVAVDGASGRRTSPFLKWIDLLFPACLPLVDLTTKFLVSQSLKRQFVHPRGDAFDRDGHFPIDLPNFDSRGIANPIALIHDRLKIGLDSEGMRTMSHAETARKSAWLLLALSSELPTPQPL